MRLFVYVIALLLIAGAVSAAEFVPGVAASDAGRIADKSKDEFYAFYIPADTAVDAVLPDVSKTLIQAAKAKANLAIFGPDYALNAKILMVAFQSARKGSLKGATILYVNGGEDINDLNKAATSAGAKFRATQYSGN